MQTCFFLPSASLPQSQKKKKAKKAPSEMIAKLGTVVPTMRARMGEMKRRELKEMNDAMRGKQGEVCVRKSLKKLANWERPAQTLQFGDSQRRLSF